MTTPCTHATHRAREEERQRGGGRGGEAEARTRRTDTPHAHSLDAGAVCLYHLLMPYACAVCSCRLTCRLLHAACCLQAARRGHLCAPDHDALRDDEGPQRKHQPSDAELVQGALRDCSQHPAVTCTCVASSSDVSRGGPANAPLLCGVARAYTQPREPTSAALLAADMATRPPKEEGAMGSHMGSRSVLC
jgi:hypothetical protein